MAKRFLISLLIIKEQTLSVGNLSEINEKT